MSTTEEATEVSPKNKTLYVKADDLPVWEEAEELAGRQSMSALVTDLLREWVDQEKRGSHRIVLDVQEAFGMTRQKKAFQGRIVTTISPGPSGTDWTVYETSKGALVLFDGFTLAIYSGFDHMRRDLPQPEVLAQIRKALDRDYVEELDI